MGQDEVNLPETSQRPHDEASAGLSGPANQDAPVYVLHEAIVTTDLPRVDTDVSISVEESPPSPGIVRDSSTMDLLGASAPHGRTDSIVSGSSTAASLTEHDASQPISQHNLINLKPSLSSLAKPPESQEGGTILSPIPSASPGNSVGPASPVAAPQPAAAAAAATPPATPNSQGATPPKQPSKLKKTSSNFFVS